MYNGNISKLKTLIETIFIKITYKRTGVARVHLVCRPIQIVCILRKIECTDRMHIERNCDGLRPSVNNPNELSCCYKRRRQNQRWRKEIPSTTMTPKIMPTIMPSSTEPSTTTTNIRNNFLYKTTSKYHIGLLITKLFWKFLFYFFIILSE